MRVDIKAIFMDFKFKFNIYDILKFAYRGSL